MKTNHAITKHSIATRKKLFVVLCGILDIASLKETFPKVDAADELAVSLKSTKLITPYKELKGSMTPYK